MSNLRSAARALLDALPKCENEQYSVPESEECSDVATHESATGHPMMEGWKLCDAHAAPHDDDLPYVAAVRALTAALRETEDER
jgi:hypothetical protein